MRHSGTHQKDLSTFSGILDLAYNYQKSKVLLTACELGIFSVLGNEAKSAKEISHEIDTDERATEKLLNALCGITLLQKRGIQYVNTRGARWYLVEESPDFIGNLMHLTDLWDEFGKLTTALKIGQQDLFNKRKKTTIQQIKRAVSYRHKHSIKQAPEVVNLIPLKKVNRILDLGGGSGTFAAEMLKVNPNLEIVLFDLPEVTPFAEEYLKKEGCLDSVQIISGDFFTDNFGDRYDIVLLSNVLHRYSLWENISLVRKVYNNVETRGKLYVHDYILDDDRTTPISSAMYSLQMLVTSKAGETYTKTDLWIMLKEAWFRNIQVFPTEFQQSLIVAER